MSAISLERGIDSISNLPVGDENHMFPKGKVGLGGAFLPPPRELDKVIRLLSLSQKLLDRISPTSFHPELLDASCLSGTREAAQQSLQAATANATGSKRDALQKAADILAQEMQFDGEVRTALASLMKG